MGAGGEAQATAAATTATAAAVVEEAAGKGEVTLWVVKLKLSTVVLLYVLAASAVWVGMHWHHRRGALGKAEEGIVCMCEERARMLQDQFAVSVNHVHALAILVATFHYEKQPPALDQDTFADYTARTSFERPLLSGVAYAQRVMHADRDAFERQQGWIIKTMKHQPSPEQDEYAPVIYSQETISYIEGLDVMSGAVAGFTPSPEELRLRACDSTKPNETDGDLATNTSLVGDLEGVDAATSSRNQGEAHGDHRGAQES